MSALVVNMYGAPGSGKSTGAAYVFSKLKLLGVNAELVTEVAKDMVWEHNETALYNQAYIFGNQFYRLSRCEDKVDVIVTDSPILLSLVYNKNKRLSDSFYQMVVDVSNSYESIDVLIHRNIPYTPVGRKHTVEESDTLFCAIESMLSKYTNGLWMDVNGNTKGYDAVVKAVLQRLKLVPINE